MLGTMVPGRADHLVISTTLTIYNVFTNKKRDFSNPLIFCLAIDRCMIYSKTKYYVHTTIWVTTAHSDVKIRDFISEATSCYLV